MNAIVDVGVPGRSQHSLHFYASQDEEHVCMEVHNANHTIDLGERSHHYALLVLARQRLADALGQLDEEEQGWVRLDRLATMLGLNPEHLNIQIYRVRKQFARALPQGAPVPELIERRRGYVRFGDWPFRITRGAEFEGEFDPWPLDSLCLSN